MTSGIHRALGATAVVLLAGASAAQAQANRPWVDPPTVGSTKAEAPPPAPSSSQAAPAPAPAPAPAVAAKPAAAPAPEPAARPAKKRLVRAKPKPSVEARRVEDGQVDMRRAGDGRATANRRAVAADQSRRERVIREAGSEPLEVMNLRTIEFPDGRRIQVLTRPDPDDVSELLRR